MEEPNEHLQNRRTELKKELRELEAELREHDIHRAWLRRVPEWFWWPIFTLHTLLTDMLPVRRAGGSPTIHHFVRYADLKTFAVNLIFIIILLHLVGWMITL